MSKSNFLLVDLNEAKTKKLAETITSDTSRKILNHLAEKDNSEANISTILNLPISTVHYHLQKLMEANLVKVEEFHYSQKGREINHYKLANKYIIIAPGKVYGLKEKLKGILPVGLIILGITAVIKIFSGRNAMFSAGMEKTTASMLAKSAPEMLDNSVTVASSSQPDISLWFLIGSLVTIVVYVMVQLIKEWRKKNSKMVFV